MVHRQCYFYCCYYYYYYYCRHWSGYIRGGHDDLNKQSSNSPRYPLMKNINSHRNSFNVRRTRVEDAIQLVADLLDGDGHD